MGKKKNRRARGRVAKDCDPLVFDELLQMAERIRTPLSDLISTASVSAANLARMRYVAVDPAVDPPSVVVLQDVPAEPVDPLVVAGIIPATPRLSPIRRWQEEQARVELQAQHAMMLKERPGVLALLNFAYGRSRLCECAACLGAPPVKLTCQLCGFVGFAARLACNCGAATPGEAHSCEHGRAVCPVCAGDGADIDPWKLLRAIRGAAMQEAQG